MQKRPSPFLKSWWSQLVSRALNEPSKDAKRVQGFWGCNGVHHWGALSNGMDTEGRNRHYPAVPKFQGGDVTHIAGSRTLYAYRPLSGHDRNALAGGVSVTMQARFILCACPFCRHGVSKEEASCPYQHEFGKWEDYVLKRVGGVVSKGSKVLTRNCGGEKCTKCKITSHCELRGTTLAAVAKLTKANSKKVMLLCDGCNEPWHVGGLPGKKTRVPLTYNWFCPACAQPCEVCDHKDDFDEPLKRLLRCSTCDKSMHMHCLNTRLEKEPSKKWRCGECLSHRMTTRLMAAKECCAHCYEDVKNGEGCVECAQCSILWHTKNQCLKAYDRPKKGQKNWQCPECAI